MSNIPLKSKVLHNKIVNYIGFWGENGAPINFQFLLIEPIKCRLIPCPVKIFSGDHRLAQTFDRTHYVDPCKGAVENIHDH